MDTFWAGHRLPASSQLANAVLDVAAFARAAPSGCRHTCEWAAIGNQLQIGGCVWLGFGDGDLENLAMS
jgi:hypothetical protein